MRRHIEVVQNLLRYRSSMKRKLEKVESMEPLSQLEYAIDAQQEITDELLNPAVRDGTYLGHGVEGDAYLCGNWVIKSFYKKRNRETEENAHLDIWRRLSPECKQYVCQPIKVNSEKFTLQRVAREDGWGSVNLANLFTPEDIPLEIETEIKNAELCLKEAGYVHNDLYSTVYDSKTNRYLKRYNNIVLLWREVFLHEVLYTVKFIDFGHATKF